MALELYKNRKSLRLVFVIRREKSKILVQYQHSGQKRWYKDCDFDEVFEKTK